MARLPSERYLMQQTGRDVVLFEDMTEREIARFDPSDRDAVARAQKTIHDSELGDEDKYFAHFWAGYFYAYLSPAEARIDAALELLGRYNAVEGAQHKQWVLNQVALLLSAGSCGLVDEGTAP